MTKLIKVLCQFMLPPDGNKLIDRPEDIGHWIKFHADNYPKYDPYRQLGYYESGAKLKPTP